MQNIIVQNILRTDKRYLDLELILPSEYLILEVKEYHIKEKNINLPFTQASIVFSNKPRNIFYIHNFSCID